MGHPTSDQIRQQFLDFFASRGKHTIVPSAPVVPHDDPTLLFTNAGMNQFKPLFLGTVDPASPLYGLTCAADTQKCIRAGGKHNDLEDVGKDTYHHTFFEMLGNWSFGDYFKPEAIAWAWELLTEIFQFPADRLYATYFGGDKAAGLEPDLEARDLWLRHLPESRVLPGNMKDNFWEMGETGPCGPCSEIHFDRIGNRDAASLVNQDDPDVLEVWNLVFIQFDRRSATELVPLPARHVDTGMGLERLVSVLQNVRSNYDTDLFTPIFESIQKHTDAPHPYTGKVGPSDTDTVDTAYRVIADHVRTLSFAIADGAVPSNEGRGYVLRRVLRRAVRFGRQMLGAQTGFLAEVVPSVVDKMGHAFPELAEHKTKIIEIIKDEEESFGRTLDKGIKLFWNSVWKSLKDAERSKNAAKPIEGIRAFGQMADSGHSQAEQMESAQHSGVMERDYVFVQQTRGPNLWEGRLRDINSGVIALVLDDPPVISGEDAFQLYDTYGFPLDLTQLMAEERGLTVDVEGFNRCMDEQRTRSREGGKSDTDARLNLPADAVARLRHLEIKPTDDADKYHARPILADVKAIWNGRDFDVNTKPSASAPVAVILSATNHYAEAGGQVGDVGTMHVVHEDRSDPNDTHDKGEFKVRHTRADGGYILHEGTCTRGEIRVGDRVEIRVDQGARTPTMANHTGTHLLNHALREVLGDTVDQKGSLVAPDRLRFDFSHNKPMTDAELADVESRVARAIEQDLSVYTEIVPLNVARQINGVRAVFGETYPDPVRVVAIGQPVNDLTDDPDNPAWRELSVEFCGGTHLATSSEAHAFVITSETGIAKGIRRIEALTGPAAMAAHQAADGVARQITESANLEGDDLERIAKSISGQIDGLDISVVHRASLRERLATLQERVKAARKERQKEQAKLACAKAGEIADAHLMAGDDVIISSIDCGSDRGALQQALKTIQQKAPDAAVLLLSADDDPEDPKVAVIAGVGPRHVEAGLKAGDWVREVSQVLGGKGGGRPDQAQGGGKDVSRLAEAIETAKRFAHKVIQ